ncbi:MAG TPA: VOC family protein [Candidatus Limnocylindria bacterium]|nr:VOC family protein [Candidatus Limnocylindria bacterium]
MTTPVLHHIALSVHDIDKSADWYTRLFDLTLVAEVEEPAPMKIFMTPKGQAIDLRQDPAVAPEAFTQERVGLDHVGFVCADRPELDTWLARLQEFGVLESVITESPFGWHLNFRDPDGIPFEFFLPA